MNKLIAVVIAVGLFSAFQVAVAEDAKPAAKEIKGALIDNQCAAGQLKKDNPEEAALKHPASCAAKEGCAKSGFSVIMGKKQYKFDENGNKLAKEFLAKETAKEKPSVKVIVVGTPNEDAGTIAVKEIKLQEEKKA